MPGPQRFAAFTGGLAVLLAALMVGIGIRMARRYGLEPVSPTTSSPPAESAFVLENEAPPAVAMGEEITPLMDEEASEAMGQESRSQESSEAEESPATVESLETDAVAPPPATTAPALPEWRRVWADLNLTEAERTRLREGLTLMWQRWLRLSPAEQQTEIRRLSALRERWEAMSDDARHQASRRMRDRFEEWRRGDRAELPELSLD